METPAIIGEINFFQAKIERIAEKMENGTNESINQDFALSFRDKNDLRHHRKILYKYLEEKELSKKFKIELPHYEYLLSGLRAKALYIDYYFKEKKLDSRKLVSYSEDCISIIQALPRIEKLYMMVFMRSSDVMELFPVDMCGILWITQCIHNEVYTYLPVSPSIHVNVLIGSAHYYPGGNPERKQKEENNG